MIDLHAEEWFEVTNRGHVAVVIVPEDMNIQLGDDVQIDGIKYRVKGLERFVNRLGKPQIKGERIGILAQWNI